MSLGCSGQTFVSNPQVLSAQLWVSTNVSAQAFVSVFLGCDVLGTHLTFMFIARHVSLVVCFGVLLWARIARSDVVFASQAMSRWWLLRCAAMGAHCTFRFCVCKPSLAGRLCAAVYSALMCCFGHASHV